jgi:hypothetical protein
MSGPVLASLGLVLLSVEAAFSLAHRDPVWSPAAGIAGVLLVVLGVLVG